MVWRAPHPSAVRPKCSALRTVSVNPFPDRARLPVGGTVSVESWTGETEEANVSEENIRTEEVSVSGDQLLAKVKEVLHEGNVRRVSIKNEDGDTVLEVPLTLGVVGAILAPQLAAVGAIAALLTKCTIVVEKVEG